MSTGFSRGGGTVSAVRRRSSELVSAYFEYVMTLPSFVYIMLVVGFPALYLVYLALMTNVTSIVRPAEFVGAENLIRVLRNPEFWEYFGNTLIYASASVFGGLAIQLGIALTVNTDLPYQRLWQALVLVPWGIPRVISSMMWRLMFNPNFGVINYTLIQIGIVDAPIQWFSTQAAAFATVIVTNIWGSTPLSVLILLAGLQNIPDGMYEAARVDGAGTWARFRHVTLPMLRPAIITVIVLQGLLAMRGFEIIYAMTSGGPGDATTVIAIDIFNNLIRFGNTEYAAAESLILVVMILVTLFLLNSVLSHDEEVEL